MDLTKLLAASVLATAGLFATGCEQEDGPAEEMGESVDEAVEETRDEIDDATN